MFWLFLISLNLHAQNKVKCITRVDNDFTNIKKIKNDVCKSTTDRIENSCAFKDQKFQNKLKEYKNNLNKFVSSTAPDFKTAEEIYNSKKYSGASQSILSALSKFKKFNSEEDFSKVKEKLVESLVDYKDKYHCDKGVKISESKNVVMAPFYNVSSKNPYAKFKEYERENKKEIESAKNSALLRADEIALERYGTIDKAFNRHIVCNTQSKINLENGQPAASVPYKEYNECPPIDVSDSYQDNKFDSLDAEKLKQQISSSQTNEKFKKCYDKMIASNRKIEKIVIESSSSLLNNTSPYFCKKDFIGLSNARAENAKESLAGVLPNYEILKSNRKIITEFPNPEGVSGECPYKIINGQEILKPEYTSAIGKKSLDKNKFVKIKLIFEPSSAPIESNDYSFDAVVDCVHFDFSCDQ